MSATAALRFENDGRPVSLEKRIDRALALYGVLITDNVDLSRTPSLEAKARVIGKALIERGDARAYVLGRELLAAAPRS